MTVSSTSNRKTFAGDDVTTSFGTSPVVFFDTEDLTVYVTDDTTGNATLLVEDSDYSVTGGDNAAGTVDLSGGSSPWGALLSDTTLVIVRELDIVQESDFINNDPSDAEVSEEALDRLTMIAQQLSSRVDRAFKLADSDVSNIDVTLPSVDERAGKLFGFNDLGEPVVFAPTTDVTLASDANFYQSGTGSVVTDLQSRGRLVLYATDKMTAAQIADGLAGTASLNLTTAVANAYADLDAQSGGVIIFPRGKWAFNLVVLKDNVQLLMYGSDLGNDATSPEIGFVPWNPAAFTVKVSDDSQYTRGFVCDATFYGVGPNGRGIGGLHLAGGTTLADIDRVRSSGHSTNNILVEGGPTLGTTTVSGRVYTASPTSLALLKTHHSLEIRNSGGATLRLGDIMLGGYQSGPDGGAVGLDFNLGSALHLVDTGGIGYDGWVNCNADDHGVTIDATNTSSWLFGKGTVENQAGGPCVTATESVASRRSLSYFLRGQIGAVGSLRYGATAADLGSNSPGGTDTGVQEVFYSANFQPVISQPKILGATYYGKNGEASAGATPSGNPNVVALNTGTQAALTVSTCAAGATLNRVRVTTTAVHGLTTGDRVTIASVTGTTEANGNWQVVVIDTTKIELKYSYFVNAYVGGPGTVTPVDQWQINAGASANSITIGQGDFVNTGALYNDGSAGVGGAPLEEVFNVGGKTGSNALKVNAGTAGTSGFLASDGALNPGKLNYDHSVDEWVIRAATVDEFVVGAAFSGPAVDNSNNLGEAAGTRRWKEVFCVNATINTSDANDKKDVAPLNVGLDFVRALRPVSFKWKVGQNVVTPGETEDAPPVITPIPGKRTHWGLLAQDLQKVAPEGSAIHILSDPNDPDSKQGWRPTELIPVLIKATQEQDETINKLAARLAKLEGK